MFELNKTSWVLPSIIALIIGILVFDLTTARGSAEYIFYIVPVALTFLYHRPVLPLYIAVLTTCSSVLGFWYSPVVYTSVNPFAFKNRLFNIVVIWIVAFLVRNIIINRNVNLRNNWLKSLAQKLQDSVRGELTVQEIGEKILSFLSSEIHVLLGVLYVREENSKVMRFAASYGVEGQSVKQQLTLGDGITGKVAEEGVIKNFTDLPADHLKLSTILGESRPGAIKIVPLLADGRTIGVLELAFKEHPDLSIREFFNLNTENLAIALRSAIHKSKLSELLSQSQQFAEELQAQQEELRVVNEELEQQSSALKSSHSRLENQAAEMEQTNQQLEGQARTLEIQKALLDERNKDLISAQMDLEEKARLLEQSSQYKSEFLANMSHELRTPLNSTLILAKLLADNKPGNLNDEQIKYADIIYNSGNDLLNLINDILDLSKVEAGKLTVNPESVSIPSIARSLEDLFRPIAKNKGVAFEVLTDKNLSTLVTDKQRVEQILKNFLSNALKFTAQGKVTLKISEKDQNFYFSVIDTGLGISSEQQKIIFEAFRQADGTTNRKFGGTGLGLSISRELSLLLGGEISVESEKEKGSTFTLRLPAKFVAEEAIMKKVELVRELPKPKPAPKKTETLKMNEEGFLSFSFKDDRENIQAFGRKMLIVEDDETFAKILFDLAHEMNFGAIVSPNADQGIQLAKFYLPHAIVLDVRLPDHSGMVVLDQLKMDPKTRHIPVHVISADDFSRSAMEMGAIGYLLKPVKREQLQDVFNHMTSLMEQKNKHVLVVEDDEVQRNHIVGLIADQNVQVDSVDTSAKALEKLAHKTYDCMIMDLSLPDMSGHELLSKLSEDDSNFSYPPVIVYTARDLTREEEEKLRQYSGSIIIKGAKSPERLLSEVTLFLHRVETDMPLEHQKMLVDLRSREKNLEGRKILLVDDDVRNIFALTSALESFGAKIESARNGIEALEKVQNLPGIELVLMDIMMPEMDGYEAMRRIRLMKKFESLPIIALTAKAMSDDKDKCIAMGANDYLSKPIVMEKLLSLIRVWLPPKRKFNS
jgi:signal transduction histidine kinase/DNA-binding response OmpR family regulator